MKILVVEDNGLMAQMIAAALTSHRFNVSIVSDPCAAIEMVQSYDFDAMILDLRLNGQSGLEVLTKLRRLSLKVPVLVLSGDLETETKVAALQAGADDYMTKPYKANELAARLTAIVRRSNGHVQSEIRIDRLQILLDRYEACVDGHPLGLTVKEYQLLEVLALRKGQTVTKEMMLNKLYGGRDEPDAKIVDVFICKLRKKLSRALGDCMIRTVWGRGYMLGGEQAAMPIEYRRRA
jgi:two-component system, cell cycle response regulator CtrA